MEKENILQLKNISVNYSGIKVLDNVNIFLNNGEIIALMGPNGAGKSTVLKAIFGLTPISDGEIFLYHKKTLPIYHQIVRMGVAFVPQGRRVFSQMTIKENLEIGGFILKDKEKLKNKMSDILDFFPVLKQKINLKASVLSGGQQQMLALARGLMTDPKILLLDEPTLGLSPKVVKDVFAKIKEINSEYKISVIIVEHNIKPVLDIVHRAYVLNNGKVIYSDYSDVILKSDILEKVFMGISK